MTEQANQPAFPAQGGVLAQDDKGHTRTFPYLRPGLTKREYFAGLAMQAIAGMYMGEGEGHQTYVAELSVACADALLLALEKSP